MPTQKEMGVACLAPTPDAFGGWGDLDWNEVKGHLAKIQDALAEAGLTHQWSTLDQGPEMLWTSHALKGYVDMGTVARVMLPAMTMAKRWDSRAKATGNHPFTREGWERLVRGLFRAPATPERCRRVNVVAKVADARAWHTALDRVVDRVSTVVLVWPKAAGDWRNSKDAKAAEARRALRKRLPVRVLTCETAKGASPVQKDLVRVIDDAVFV